MAPRFDGDRAKLELAVADLLDAQLVRHLGFAHRGGYERMWLGQAIHSRYQDQAFAQDPRYQKEVPLAVTFDHRGWEVTVLGRVDGLRQDPDGALVVEEIKSVRRGGDLPPATREIYQRQALLYAWMLWKRGDRPAGELRAELVLIEIGSDETHRLELDVDLDALEAAVRVRLNGLIRGFERGRREATDRHQAALRLTFPFAEQRRGQEEIVAAAQTALAHGEHVLIQAPTGIGKTVAALFPALQHALATDRRVFVLTAKTLQQEMAATVLGLLNGERAFRSLRLKAKAKMCANDQVLCHEEYCPFARDYYAKLAGSRIVERLLRDGDLLDPEAIFTAASQAQVCPFEVSLELGRRVQVVVCDYNYAFDPYVSLTEFGPDHDLRDTVLVIDEIHNLVDRGRGYYSPDLTAAQARLVERLATEGREAIHGRIAGLARALAELIDQTVEDAFAGAIGWIARGSGSQGGAGGEGPREQALEARLPEDALWLLRRDFDTAFIDYLEHQRQHKSLAAGDPFVDLYFRLLRFLNGLVAAQGDAFSQLVEVRTDTRALKLLCKDPSRFLGAVINRTHATLGLSATLSPPEFYRDLLGFAPGRTAHVSVPSPFPAEHRRIVIDPSVETTYRARPANYDRIAGRLSELADAVPGNCLVLFPSYGFLAAVAPFLRTASKRVLVQERGAGDRERESILEALRGALFGDVLLLAVAGGVFAEGVDYPGDMLKAVAVVGPCLPAVSLEQQLLQQYYDERFERGFEYAFVVPGMTRVIQAAGRLIRSGEDTGVIALLDRRFLRGPYRQHLPEDWVPAEGLRGVTGNPARAAAEFFATRSLPPGDRPRVTGRVASSAKKEPRS